MNHNVRKSKHTTGESMWRYSQTWGEKEWPSLVQPFSQPGKDIKHVSEAF